MSSASSVTCSAASSVTSDESENSSSSSKKRKFLNPENNKLHLTLENFDSDDIPSDYPYVLTSPRSLAACKHFAVRVSFNT